LALLVVTQALPSQSSAKSCPSTWPGAYFTISSTLPVAEPSVWMGIRPRNGAANILTKYKYLPSLWYFQWF
jgi:hypothetical protein